MSHGRWMLLVVEYSCSLVSLTRYEDDSTANSTEGLLVDSICADCFVFFFFSSRRRHTRLQGDWSSDVCSSDLPYTRAATALDASIPSWAESGGWDSLLARLRDPATRARLRDEMVNPKGTESFYYEAGGGDGVLITGTFQDSLRSLQGKTVGEIAARRHRDPVETLFDIVLAENGHRTDAVYAVMSEPDVQTAMKTWWVA